MRHVSLLLFAALSALSACTTDKKADAPAARTSYNTEVEGYIVRPSPLSEKIVVSGSLLPAEETALHTEASGRVVQINLPEGRSVRKNDLLLKVFDGDLRARISQLDTRLQQAQITESRLGDLLKVRGVSQQEYDMASLEVKNLRTEMELVQIDIAKTELRAPYDGVIGLRRISPGAYVTPSTSVASIRATSALKLDFSVPEKYSSGIRQGQKVSFTVQGGNRPYEAVVQASEQRISTDSRNLLVRAQVSGAHKELLPGAFAEVNLILDQRPDALMVPSQAVVAQARDKKIIVSRAGKADFVTVKTGVRQAGMLEITEGLQKGDTIAVTGILFLRPNGDMSFSKVN